MTGERLAGPAIAAAAEAGEAKADATMARYEERLGRALAHIVNIIDPQVIVLGGGLSRVKRLYERVPALMIPTCVLGSGRDPRSLPARYGDSSGVRGAAWLWRPEEAD